MNALSRRKFLKSTAGLATLMIAVSNTPHILAQDAPDNTGHVTPCLRVDENGNVILCVPIPDMGQGMVTTAAQMIAEELDIDLDTVSVELMPFLGQTNEEGRAVFGRFYQGGGGSGSTMRIWNQVRRTAAYARAILIEAASREWKTAKYGLTTENGHVINARTGERLPYTKLIARAQNVGGEIIADSQPLKKQADFKTIGKNCRNVQNKQIVTGEPLFGIDADVPGMLHAVIRRCPHLKGEVKNYDAKRARAMPGVKAIVPMKRLPEDINAYRQVAAGIAVVADTFWNAKKAADALEIEWDGSISEDSDSRLLKEKLHRALDEADMTVSTEAGDLEATFSAADSVHEAIYYHPHWAHTNMEPHNCVAHIKGDEAEIWVAHQFMDAAINAVNLAVGIPPEKVKAHFYRMGTGFGRKFEEDYVMEACIISKEIGEPVKVTWSREDEIEQDYCNSMVAYKIRAALDHRGDITAWHMRAAGDTVPAVASREFPAGIVDVYKGEYYQEPNHISRGAWRGPHHNVIAWVNQGFLNELAIKTGRDPLEYLISLYKRKKVLKSQNWPYRDHYFEHYIAVLEKAAEEAGYDGRLPDGWGRGIAVHHTFVSVCAHVVDVEMTSEQDFKVHKVTSAIDCGLVVNPLGVRAQVESGIMDGICAAKYGNLVFERGVPVTNNFDTYQKMRIDEAPPLVDIHLLDMGDTEPRGTGEVSLPPVIPALTNAIYAASGKRITTLPINS